MSERHRFWHWLKIALWFAYALVWSGGVGGHLMFGSTPANMTWAAPLFLLLASILVMLAAPDDWRALLITFTIGFIAEVIGVKTGYPFSGYAYSTVLEPSILGVPPVMAGAWMILIAWVRQMRIPFWCGALVMVGIDLSIDPLAANALAFWKWQNSGPYYGIPFANFLGWFLVSALILWLLRAKPRRNGEVWLLGISILNFFALVGYAHHYLVPASVAILLCGAGYWRWSSSSKSTSI